MLLHPRSISGAIVTTALLLTSCKQGIQHDHELAAQAMSHCMNELGLTMTAYKSETPLGLESPSSSKERFNDLRSNEQKRKFITNAGCKIEQDHNQKQTGVITGIIEYKEECLKTVCPVEEKEFMASFPTTFPWQTLPRDAQEKELYGTIKNP